MRLDVVCFVVYVCFVVSVLYFTILRVFYYFNQNSAFLSKIVDSFNP